MSTLHKTPSGITGIFLLAFLLVIGTALVACDDDEVPDKIPSPSTAEVSSPTVAAPLAKSTPAPNHVAEPPSTAAKVPPPEPVRSPATTPTPSQTIEGNTYVHRPLGTGTPGMNQYSSSLPGQSEVLQREYESAPPLVPHDISGFVITKDFNTCLVCHTRGETIRAGHTATRIPDSHYLDLPTGTVSQSLQALRYDCLICHVPQ